MQAIRLPKHSAGLAFLVASVFVAAGVWVAFHTPGKNGFDSIPLFWLMAVVCAPLFSTVCVVAMWRQRASPWLASLATLLLLPQCVVLYFAVRGVLYYLGVME